MAALVLSLSVMAAKGNASQGVDQTRFDGWGYNLVTDPDGAKHATVEYDHASVADLKRYADINRVLARQLAADGEKELAISISFRRPLSVDEFRAWAASVPLKVDDFQLRVLAADGTRWTLGGAPSRGEVVSVTDLQRNLNYLASKGATDVRGVIVVEGRVAAADYDTLATNSSVFLADVTRTAAAAHAAKTRSGIDRGKLSVLVSPAFATMEDLGLANFS